MIRNYHLLLLSCFFLLTFGCGSKMQTDISPPIDHNIEDSRVYNAPYDRTWKAIIQSVGSSFFVLENIQKDSGILTLSFSTNEPKNFIDCGKVHDYGTIGLVKHDMTYNGTDSNIVRKFVEPNGVAGEVLRTCALNGKSNILVQAIGAKQTRVTVKTRYVFTLNNLIAPYGAPYPVKVDHTMTFTGNEVGSFTSDGNSIQCRSRGVLEKDILNGIERDIN